MLTKAIKPRERRYSKRWQSGRSLEWRTDREGETRLAKIVERSLNGFVLLVPVCEAPAEGAYVLPASTQVGDRHGFREAIVRRTRCDGDQSILSVEILA
jgi:hypothetical protein